MEGNSDSMRSFGFIGICPKICRWILALAWVGCTAVSCAQPNECPKPAQCSCPPQSPCPIAGQVQLGQLDPQARERLKSEVTQEIRAELKAQWRQEFEEEMRQAANKPTPEPGEQTVAVQNNQPLPPPQVQPKPLPPTQKIERDSGGLKILRHVFSTQIDHRQPVDEREAFSVSDSTVFCFVEISSSDDEERTITIRFIHSTGMSQSYSLPVGQSPAWRTWSKLNLTKSMTGTWLCEVFNEDGALLASKPFVIVDDR